MFTRAFSKSVLAVEGSLQRTGGRFGAGGRASVSGVTATLFGATGFLGRYFASALGKIGSQLVIPYRTTENGVQHFKVMGDLGQIVLVYAEVGDDYDTVKDLVANSNVVINCIGRDKETWKYSFDDVNVKMPEMIARAAKEVGAERLYHMSCLGAAPDSASKKFRTKFEGERAVLSEFPDATIFRMAPVVGVEDRFLNSFAYLSKRSFYMPLYDGGESLMQPVWVKDVQSAFMKTMLDNECKGKTYELAGPDVYSVKDLVTLVEKIMREPSGGLFVPSAVGKLMDKPREFLQERIPFPIPIHPMFTADYIDELQTDVIRKDPTALGFEDLGIAPKPINQGVPIDHVRYWRSGGYDFGTQFDPEETDLKKLEKGA